MQRTTTIAAVIGVAVLLSGCAGGGDSGDNAAFATAACTGWAGWVSAEADANATLDDLVRAENENIEEQDREAQKQELLDAVTASLTQLRAAKDAVVAAPPAGSGADTILAAFSDYYDARIASVEAHLAEFEATPADDAGILGFAGGPGSDFVYAASEMGDDVDDLDFPFRAIENQDVVAAIEAEPSCGDVVEVRG